MPHPEASKINFVMLFSTENRGIDVDESKDKSSHEVQNI